MRLIDADALKELKFPNGESEYVTGWNDAISAIMTFQPTIDAIPIEFIQKRIDQLEEMNGRIFDYERWELERLVRKWREENATAD